MTTLHKPLGKRRALLIAIRHVHREAGLKFGNLPNIDLTHRDAKALRDFLIASHGYHTDDIILMMDDKNHPKHLWPTHGKILHQIDRLTSDAPEDCRFFFYFSGHCLKDGTDNEIVCADAKPILGHILQDRLVTPLQNVKGSKLFTLFDCSHSEGLFDLQRGIGPNKHSRVRKFDPGRLFTDLSTVITDLYELSKEYRQKHSDVPPPLRRASTEWNSPPTSKIMKVGELSTICLSACRDGQLAHDDCERELTFTKCFMDAIAVKPNITWTELRDKLEELIADIWARYDETYLQGSSSESDVTHETWTQEPRISTDSHTDLTRRVTF